MIKQLRHHLMILLRGFFIKIITNGDFFFTGRHIAFSSCLRFGTKAKLVLGRNVKVSRHVKMIVDDVAEVTIGNESSIDRGGEVTAGNGAKLYIGSNTAIGSYCNIRTTKHISIGDNCLIAQFITIVDGGYDYRDKEQIINMQRYISKDVHIGNNVWIGACSIILSGVSVGSGAVIGAGTIVTKDIPPFAIAVGNPAKIIGYRK